GGVCLCATAARLGQGEDGLNPAAFPRSRLGNAPPQRLDHLHHQGRIYVLHPHSTDQWLHMLGKAVCPLPPMQCAPAGLAARDERITALPEGHRRCPCNTLRCPFRTSLFDWIDTVKPQLSRLCGLLAGFRKRDGVQRPEPHLTRPCIEHVAVNPGSPALSDLQIEPATLGIHAGCLRPRHFKCRQPSNPTSHASAPSVYPQADPQRTCGLWRRTANV